jgi:cathepsin L
MAFRTLTLFACGIETATGLLNLRGLAGFDSFVETYGRDFQVGSSEYAFRKSIYERSLEKVQRHNAYPNRLWTAGINHLSDRTEEEFQQRLGWRHHDRTAREGGGVASMLEIERASSFDVNQDADYSNLTMARDGADQGGCGSCWAVATAELLKAHSEIRNGKPTTFSTQELVSCVKNPKKCGGAGGCDGATVEIALDYVMLNGLRHATDLPYQATTGTCDKEIIDSKHPELDEEGREVFPGQEDHGHSMMQGNGLGLGAQTVGLMGFRTLPKNKFEPLMKALLEVGPLAVTVAASDWSSYSSGLFSCTDPTLNHAVLLMGTQGSHGKKSYLVKNSWGPTWGEKGYIRLLRTDNEEQNCATDTSPADGVACEGGPKSVLACGTCGILYDNVIPSMSAMDKGAKGKNQQVFLDTNAKGKKEAAKEDVF